MSQEPDTAVDQPAAMIPEYAREISVRPASVPWGVAAVVAVKVSGFVLLVGALPLLYLVPSYVFALGRTGWQYSGEYLLSLLGPALYLAVGAFLIWRAHWVATSVLGFSDAREEFAFRAPGRRFQALAFSVLGVWLAISGTGELAGVIARASITSKVYGNDLTRGDSLFAWADVSAPFVKLVAGVCLFLGAKRLAHYWHRFRMQPQGPTRDHDA